MYFFSLHKTLTHSQGSIPICNTKQTFHSVSSSSSPSLSPSPPSLEAMIASTRLRKDGNDHEGWNQFHNQFATLRRLRGDGEIPNLEAWGGLMGPDYNYFERGNLDVFRGSSGGCLSSPVCAIDLTLDGSGSRYVEIPVIRSILTIHLLSYQLKFRRQLTNVSSTIKIKINRAPFILFILFRQATIHISFCSNGWIQYDFYEIEELIKT